MSWLPPKYAKNRTRGNLLWCTSAHLYQMRENSNLLIETIKRNGTINKICNKLILSSVQQKHSIKQSWWCKKLLQVGVNKAVIKAVMLRQMEFIQREIHHKLRSSSVLKNSFEALAQKSLQNARYFTLSLYWNSKKLSIINYDRS